MRILFSFALVCAVVSSSFNAEAQVRGGRDRGRSAATIGRPSSIVVTGPDFGIPRRVRVPFVRQPGFFYQPFPWAAPIYPAPIIPAPIYLAPLYTSLPYDSFEESIPYSVNSVDELSYRVKRLTQEIKRMRRGQEIKRVDGAQERRDQVAPEPAPLSETTVLPTILVFRDGRRMEIQNYAIADQTLWVFTGRSSTRISLADLDLEATINANADQGGRFSLPR